MTGEHEADAQGAFTGSTHFDEKLASTIITLSYVDTAQPARNISMRLAPDLGNNMFSFRVGEHELLYCQEESLKHKGFTGNFVLWPFPNRIRNKRYTYQGKVYSLQSVDRTSIQNDPLIHGLVMDRQWCYEQPLEREDAVSVRTFVEMMPDSPYYEAYPFESRLTLTYTLTAYGVTVAYEVHNRGTHDLPYGFAMHPYFAALSGLHATHVSLPATLVMEADEAQLPTGRLLQLDGIMYSMFDLRRPVPLDHLKLDHVYTGIPAHAEALIIYPQQHLRLRLATSPEFTHFVIYTSPNPAQHFVCIENQTCSTDAINLHEQGHTEIAHLLELRSGEVGRGHIQFFVEHEA